MTQAREQRSGDTALRQQKQCVLRSGQWELNWEPGAPSAHHGLPTLGV